MNDRYLFKAKRIDNGEWVVGNLVYSEDVDEDFKAIIVPTKDNGMYANFDDMDLGFENWHKVDPTTICQCTSFKDKNGNLIWENDLVYARCNGLSGKGVVKFENGCFVLKDGKRSRTYSLFGEWKFRVDGNIFDNPELLEME